MKRRVAHRILGGFFVIVCIFTAILHGFSPKKGSDVKCEDLEASLSEVEALFPRFTVSARPKGIESDLHFDVITPTDGGELLLRWGDTELAVSKSVLETALPPERSLPEVKDEEIARAAALLAPRVTSRYLIWTDLHRLTTYVLESTDGKWQLLRRLPCSAGDAAHPSPEGLFRLGIHRLAFGREGYYRATSALQICGNYFYHSVLLTPGGDEVLDGRLGERISHGCIRHSRDDSRWLYETIPDGTAILIR